MHDILYNYQFSFRKHHSTILALIDVAEDQKLNGLLLFVDKCYLFIYYLFIYLFIYYYLLFIYLK